MGAGVGDLVAVGRPAAEVAALYAGLCGHRRADPELDAAAFAFADAAVEGQVVGLAARVDGSADLGHPQLHAVVDQGGESHTELDAVEDALGFSDDHRWRITHCAGDNISTPAAGLRSPRRGRSKSRDTHSRSTASESASDRSG